MCLLEYSIYGLLIIQRYGIFLNRLKWAFNRGLTGKSLLFNKILPKKDASFPGWVAWKAVPTF